MRAEREKIGRKETFARPRVSLSFQMSEEVVSHVGQRLRAVLATRAALTRAGFSVDAGQVAALRELVLLIGRFIDGRGSGVAFVTSAAVKEPDNVDFR